MPNVGPEFIVNSTTAHNQTEPSVARLADGRFVVTWNDHDSGTWDGVIRARLFNADGSAASADFRVALYSDETTMLEPQVATLADGHFVVTWMHQQNPGSDWDIRARLFNADGTAAGADFLVHDSPLYSSWEPAVGALWNGGFVVTYSQEGNVQGRIYSSSGTSSEFLLTSYFPNSTYPSDGGSVTALPDGRFLVAWHFDSDTAEGSLGIRARLFNADGTAAGSVFQVNTTTAGDQQDADATALPSGGFLVTWSDDGNIRARLFNSTGTALGADFQVNATAASVPSPPEVATLADGRFLVTWASSAGDIRARLFNADGTARGAEFQVNTITANQQSAPDVVALSDESFLVTWQSNDGGDGSGWAIRAQVVAVDDNGGINDSILSQTKYGPFGTALWNFAQANALVKGYGGTYQDAYKWGNSTITWSLIDPRSSFDTSADDYGADPGPGLLSGIQTFKTAQAVGIGEALKVWEQYTNVHFVQVAESSTSAGDIRFGLSTAGFSGPTVSGITYTINGNDAARTGDIWINANHPTNTDSEYSPGGDAFHTILHEVGHAAFGYGDISRPVNANDPVTHHGLNDLSLRGTSWDSYFWTMMHYGPAGALVPSTPMYLDIVTAREMYGAPRPDSLGDSTGTNTYNVDHLSLKTIWDDGGTDTLNWAAVGVAAYIDLNPGVLTPIAGGQQVSVADQAKGWSGVEDGSFGQWNWRFYIAPLTFIENANGNSGNDRITGNDRGNILDGKGGNDTLDGGAGSDTARYSGARSSYDITKIDATTVQARDTRSGSPDGTDTVKNVEFFQFADQALSFQQLFQVAQLNATEGPDTLVLTGGQIAHALGGNDSISGNSNLNVAFGDEGGDQLYFVGDQNQLYGSEGNDWLGVNGTNNALVGGAGDEWMGASGSYNTVVGEDGNDTLFGNGVGNYLWGQGGNDWLGVSGNNNTLLGGAGVEWMGASGGGNALAGGELGDTLLSIGSNILYGENGDDWVGCSGNSNWLFGHAGNDYLAASGSNNTLDGGAGNDTLVAGGAHAGNRYVFHAGYGMDTITGFARHSAGGTDVIDLNGFGLNFNSLQVYIVDGSNCVIVLDAATALTINGTSKGQLQASDFIF